jgi:hypothetical protein
MGNFGGELPDRIPCTPYRRRFPGTHSGVSDERDTYQALYIQDTSSPSEPLVNRTLYLLNLVILSSNQRNRLHGYY